MVRKWLLLLFIPVLAAAGGQVCSQAFAKPPASDLPGIVVDLGPGEGTTPVARNPLPPVPPSGNIAVNR